MRKKDNYLKVRERERERDRRRKLQEGPSWIKENRPIDAANLGKGE